MKHTPPPAINLPPVISITATLLVLIHGARSLLDSSEEARLIATFGFWPIRYDKESLSTFDPESLAHLFPGGIGADIGAFVTYAFLHGNLFHLTLNTLWLLIFGSALAWRFGAHRFLIFSAVTAAFGALAHLVGNWGDSSPMIGASAALSGHLAAASRFIFNYGGPLSRFNVSSAESFQGPASTIKETLRNQRAAMFLGVWLALTLITGLGGLGTDNEGGRIAWEAHLGGFLSGFLLFSWFDPVPPAIKRSELKIVS